MPNATERARSRQGLAYGIAAYGLWGLVPLYFMSVVHAGSGEILAQRVFWSALLLTGVVAIAGRLGELRRLFRQRHIMLPLAASTTLIALNWLAYIYAVTSHQVLEASLGYFITPLVNVLLGCLVLGERLRPLAVVGLVVAACGVLAAMVLGGSIPWIALALAATFASYGLVRKTLALDGLLALAIETLLLLPLAVLYIAYDHILAAGPWGRFGVTSDLLLAASGPVTAVPLLCFGAAARRLKLTTLGFLQYLAPTVQLLLAVLLFGEPFRQVQWASFGCAWAAVAIYLADSLLALHERRQQAALEIAAPLAEPS